MSINSMLDRFVSTAKERVIDTVSATVRGTATAVGHISSLIGNPLSKDFDVKDHVASFGPNLGWKVYNAKKKTTGQEVSVLIFEKKLLDGMDKRDREVVIEMMKKGVQQLTRLRHPRLLVVQNPVEESRDCLAFATEPIFASLANILGKHNNMPSPLPRDIKGYEMYDVERVYGLFQLCEGLIFLHNDAKILQGNLNPDSIAITTNGQWKIGGMFFSSAPVVMDGQTSYNTCQWEPRLLPWGMPLLNYCAPEFILSRTCDLMCDMFSFGVLIYAVYNTGKPPYDCMDDITAFKRNVEQMTHRGSTPLGSVPKELQDHVRNLMGLTPSLRMDAHQMSKIEFFDNVAAMTLQYLDSLFQRDEMAKSQFFKNLYKVISKLPKRVVHQRVLPPLCQEFTNHQMIPFVLPNVLVIAEDCTQEEYEKLILPQIRPVFKIQEPIQILLIFMQKMDLLLSKTPKESVTNDVLPMVFRALEAPSQQIQELVLNIIPNFAHMIEYSAMKHSVIPRIKTLCLQTTSLAVRVHCLVCLGKILEHLDKYAVQDEILPLLPQIPSREAATLMAILGIYKQALLHKRLGLDKDYLAGKALPFLFPLAVEPALNLTQFKQFMNIIHDMMKRVETDHMTKLEQLGKMQEQTKSSLQFAQEVKEAKAMEHLLVKVDNLFSGRSSAVSLSDKSSSHSSPSRSKPVLDNTTRSAEFNRMFGLTNGAEKTPSSGTKTNSDLLSGKEVTGDNMLKPSAATTSKSKPAAQKVPLSAMKLQSHSQSPSTAMSSGPSLLSMVQQPRPSQPAMGSLSRPSQSSAISSGGMTWGMSSSNSSMSMSTGYNTMAGTGRSSMGTSGTSRGTSGMGLNPSMSPMGCNIGPSTIGSHGMMVSNSSGMLCGGGVGSNSENISGNGMGNKSGNKGDTKSFDSLMGMVPGMEHLQDRSKPSLNQMQIGRQAATGGAGPMGMRPGAPQYVGVSGPTNTGTTGMFNGPGMIGNQGMMGNSAVAGNMQHSQFQQQSANSSSAADDLKSIFG